jgi:hypothetical protein
MLRPADTVLCVVAAVIAGAAGLFVCLSLETGTALTAVAPVGAGVLVHQIALGIMKRRAWQRENAGRA